MKLSQLISQPVAKDIEIQNICGDTRALKAGDIFVYDSKIIGKTAEFVADAFKKGAAAVIVDAAGAKSLPNYTENQRIIVLEQPMAIYSKWMRSIYPRQPAFMAGVTGTNGKTSVAWFVRELLQKTGHKSASLGTLGLHVGDEERSYGGYTTLSSDKLYLQLTALADEGITHTCMEVSSHALSLRRADDVSFNAVGFTNLSQDHMDFHGTMESYFIAKLRLFTELLAENGVAVVNVDRLGNLPAPAAAMLLNAPKQNGAKVLTVGTSNAELVVEVIDAHQQGLDLNIKFADFSKPVSMALIGRFQAENIAVALGLAMASGVGIAELTEALSKIKSVPGRMELLPTFAGKPLVVVDYAHTPDALEILLKSLRPQVKGKLWVVFGCGGNRDKAKRPLMGGIAKRLADEVVVTDDNPRDENPDDIRKEIMLAVPKAHNIGNRSKAISYVLSNASELDTVLIAGKGHETGQIVGKKVLPFSDHEEALKALRAAAS